MQYPRKFCLRGGALLGFMAVACGAFGAHGLKTLLSGLPPDEAVKRLDWAATGARYQLMHAAALLALPSLAPLLTLRTLSRAAHCFFYGSLIFGLSLYAMALGAPLWLGAITPLGGLLLLAGWGLLALGRVSDV